MIINRQNPGVDSVFAALADPTRRAILSRLVGGEATVTELARPFDMTQPAISHHLKVLGDAGLIARRIDGTRRPCRLSPQGIATIDLWLEQLRGALSANYDRLDALLAAAADRDATDGDRGTPDDDTPHNHPPDPMG